MALRSETASPTQKIGMLLLEVPPDRFPGSLADPTLFPVPVVSETVAGAWVEEMLAVDPALTQPAIEAARRLERQGATLLISNCGYFIAYRDAIERAVPLPAAISSLLWLPHLNALRSPGRKIGIVTFDAVKLTRAHLEAAWPGFDPAVVAVAGLEGTEMWKNAGKKNSTYDFEEIWRDLRGALDRLLAAEPSLQFILVECCTLCAFVPLIRRHTGLPAYDIVALARWWLAGLDAGMVSEQVA